MKKREWRFEFKAISNGWQESGGKHTTHRIDAVILHSEFAHSKFDAGSPVVLHIDAEQWADELPSFEAGNRFVAISYRKPSVGAPGYKPSFVLSRAKTNQPRHIELMSILK